MSNKSKNSSKSSINSQEFLDFIKESPTSFHAVFSLKQSLLKQGFTELKENTKWEVKKSGKYFTIKDDSTLIAFIVPEKKMTGSLTVASHVDSPGLKIKPNPDFNVNNMAMVASEIYGGPLYASWLNRDLAIGGQVVFTDSKNNITKKLIKITDTPLVIPQLAIHIDREVNEKGLILNPQEHLIALAGFQEKEDKPFLKTLLLKTLKAKEILSFDLFLYPLEEPRFVGIDHSLISSYRIDNLASVWASLKAFEVQVPAKELLKVAVFFDHEEFGSRSHVGADSPLLNEFFQRIVNSQTHDVEDFLIFKSNSLIASCDLAHSVHPNYPQKHEPRHPLMLNGGIVLKNHANGKYATNCKSAALIAYLCEKNHIPLQRYVGRSDIASGSTVGPICASSLGIKTVDLGLSQLSMHSARELMGKDDVEYLAQLLNALLADENAYNLCHLK
jgi:aspartyl aminopeptidase